MSKKMIPGLLLVLTASVAFARPEHFPANTPDGLQLIPNTLVRAVYLKPGADLRRYDKIALMETHVSFVRDWESEQNEDAIPQNRISDKDMLEIREKVAREFNKEMIRVLSGEERRQIVATGGAGVLVLRPSIVDLDITVSDQGVPGMDKSLVASAASMTLVLELYDGRTGDIVARIYDPEGTDDAGVAEVSEGVNISAEFDRIVRRWAQLLNAHLARLGSRE